MKLAIMQPYFAPYIGYFQLMAAVDRFVILDDVNFINRGWINRNRIAVEGEPSWVTLPLVGASQNRLICEIDLMVDDGWKSKLIRKVAAAYSKAPNTGTGMTKFEAWMAAATGNLSVFLHHHLLDLAEYLEIRPTIIPTSRVHEKGELRGQERILDICLREGATTYVNPPGGRELYDPELFRRAGIELLFLQPNLHAGEIQTGSTSGDTLSILDIMMHNSRECLGKAMSGFELQKA